MSTTRIQPNDFLDPLQQLHTASAIHSRKNPGNAQSWAQYSSNPTQFPTALSVLDEPIIPNPKTFESFSSAKPGLPSIAECAVHLQFFDAILLLKSKVIRSNMLDRTFTVICKSRNNSEDRTWHTRRKKKWERFVAEAVRRFLKWWWALKSPAPLSADTLPPLDVLMVWHTYMQEGQVYSRDSLKKSVCSIDMPWEAINKAIDIKSGEYNLTAAAVLNFQQMTGIVQTNLLAYLSDFKAFSTAELRAMAIDEPSDFVSPGKVSGISINIYENVIRRGAFLEIMCHSLWLRSPALLGTLSRALQRYEKYMRLLTASPPPQRPLVATLDIELVWQTLLCSPRVYREMCDAHMLDEALAQHNSSHGVVDAEAMAYTTELWYLHWVEDYQRCLCWECEELLSATEKFERVGISEVVQKVKINVAYYRAVETAKRQGRALPRKRTGS
ncbi:hypothetical protein BDD12DRAFT_891085 [Trichophaea hybrida]|nr:hypothetical protein BDD12DRAFT_891085 [Trichophaea hybrida]